MAHEITAAFEQLKRDGKKAFIPYITAGDPDLETTVELVLELERSRSTVVELGIPFSDPLADGPTIQRASERALRHGYRLADHLAAVRLIRSRSAIPIVLFSYFNPIMQYGMVSLAQDACAAGVNGVLITDMTPEEGSEYRACLETLGIDPIFLVAPTSSAARIRKIVECTRGFVYIVSRIGVTGTRDRLSESVIPTVRKVRDQTDLPVVVGFGISRPEQVRAVWEIADGAVVGSAIVAEIERWSATPQLVAHVGRLCRWLTQQ
jgi:tryptophan synthase alpha chain